MAASLRLSRGFHRLGLFFAAIPLVIGIVATGYINSDVLKDALLNYNSMRCAHTYVAQAESRRDYASLLANDEDALNLKQIGCSSPRYDTITYGEARSFSLLGEAQSMGTGIAITLAVSLVVYVLFRAIGWVIGGFAAS